MTARYRAGKRLWEPEDDALVAERYPHEPTATLARSLRRSVTATYARAMKLGLAKSAAYLASPAACRLRRGDNLGKAFRFPKGHVPANKGLRRQGWAPGRMRETQFRKGERHGRAAQVYQPIGSERISKDCYLQRKVNDDLPRQARWRSVHVLVWEAAHGPLPAGHAVSFRNGDRRDVRLENLELISRRELMRRNTVHNLPAPLAQTVQLLDLFETLESLKDEEKPMDLARARAIADVARVVVDSAKVEVDFLKTTGALRCTDFLPAEGVEAPEEKPRPKPLGGGRGAR